MCWGAWTDAWRKRVQRSVLLIQLHNQVEHINDTILQMILWACFPDIDECSMESGICSHGRCENFMGGYECICDVGFKPNPLKTACTGTQQAHEPWSSIEPSCLSSFLGSSFRYWRMPCEQWRLYDHVREHPGQFLLHVSHWTQAGSWWQRVRWSVPRSWILTPLACSSLVVCCKFFLQTLMSAGNYLMCVMAEFVAICLEHIAASVERALLHRPIGRLALVGQGHGGIKVKWRSCWVILCRYRWVWDKPFHV